MKHRSRPRVLAYGLVAAAAVVAPFVIYVGGRLEIVQTGYSMDQLEDTLSELEEENRALRLEVARLADLDRIGREATKLGLQPLALDRLIVLTTPDEPAPRPPAIAERRGDPEDDEPRQP